MKPTFFYASFTQACGNSTNKKDAQTNAAKDFLLYLVRNGDITQEEIPQGVGLNEQVIII